MIHWIYVVCLLPSVVILMRACYLRGVAAGRRRMDPQAIADKRTADLMGTKY